MYKIYIGSRNKIKVKAVTDVFYNYEVISFDVSSLVNLQPMNDEETLRGAINRAKQLPSDGLRIGLEAGLYSFNDDLFTTNWGVLIDENNNIYYASSTRIPLSKELKDDILSSNQELGEIIKRHISDSAEYSTVGYLTKGLVKRYDIFYQICELLLGQYLKYKEG